ncbi:hypothetical protein CGRA01v4_10991 [Colletotrichum graminicola]|nr:hypothetical protein CGRA01v4_10991 [Colletotrichum graminicola]
MASFLHTNLTSNAPEIWRASERIGSDTNRLLRMYTLVLFVRVGISPALVIINKSRKLVVVVIVTWLI